MLEAVCCVTRGRRWPSQSVMNGMTVWIFRSLPGFAVLCVKLPRKLLVRSEIVSDGANKLIAIWRWPGVKSS